MQRKRSEWPLVSIVTVNYNGVVMTAELLDSLRRVTYPDFEIIVVDNGSSEVPDQLQMEYPEIRLIKTGINLGFAGGNNKGFEAARGKYILMLNNDTEVHPDFLFPLVEQLEADEKIGAVSPKLVYYNSSNLIQYAGSSHINPYTGRSKFRGHKEVDKGQYNDCCLTHYAHGAAMMFRKEVLNKTGMMADLYFLYYEELDFCERIKNAGYEIWYVGKSEVYHKESMTVGKLNSLKVYYMTRNRLVFMRRNAKGWKKVFSLLFFSFVSLPKNTLVYLGQNRTDLLKAFYKGYFWNWCNRRIHDNPKMNDV